MRAQTLFEARWILLILALSAVAVWFVSAWLSLVFLMLFLFTIAFFRDPDRPLPADPTLIVAPADGSKLPREE
jgi:phosphatidylserine decarboxylase